jgi:hypothetical protein
MSGFRCIASLCAVFVVASASNALAQASAATAAVKASPALVEALSKEIGGSPEQAAGAAGALFGVARSRLAPAEFSQVAAAVPGMDLLLGAAPAAPGAVGTGGTAGALSALGGGVSGLNSAMAAFSKLGLKPELVAKAIPILTSFVSKSGGADVAKILAGALT